MAFAGEAEKYVFSINIRKELTQNPKRYPNNPKNNLKINENTSFPRVPCGPVDPCGTVKLKVPPPYLASGH